MGSFSLVTCETQDTMMPHQSQDQIYVRAASSSQQAPPVDPAQDRCCCGLKLIKYTCRKQGVHYIEAILPVPERTLEHPAVQLFPMDSRDKVGEEHESTGIEAAAKHAKEVRDTLYVDELSSCKEPEEIYISPAQRKVRGSHKGSHSPQRPHEECQHQWSNRGSNAYIKMKMCKKCGYQDVYNVQKYKDNTVTRQWVDVTSYKPSGRPRAVSP